MKPVTVARMTDYSLLLNNVNLKFVGPPNTFEKNNKICHRKCRPFEQHSYKEVEIKYAALPTMMMLQTRLI